jgi:hypothetical protein
MGGVAAQGRRLGGGGRTSVEDWKTGKCAIAGDNSKKSKLHPTASHDDDEEPKLRYTASDNDREAPKLHLTKGELELGDGYAPNSS